MLIYVNKNKNSMENFLNIEHFSKVEVDKLWADKKFRGMPSENRVLVVTPKEATTKSGIYIPTDENKDIIPKRGRVIQKGAIGEEYVEMQRHLEVGDLVTYGLYAGKEVELPYLGIDSKKYTVTILSVNEILYIEKV